MVRVVLTSVGFICGNADIVQGVLFFLQPVDLFGDQVDVSDIAVDIDEFLTENKKE